METIAAIDEAVKVEEEDKKEEEAISSALYDLSVAEVDALEAMEEEILEEEAIIMADAAATGDAMVIEQAIMEIVALEEVRMDIVAEEFDLIDAIEEDEQMLVALIDAAPVVIVDFPMPTAEQRKADCAETMATYVSTVAELKSELKGVKDLTDSMADSLAEIDPNTENGAEGKALMKKMYKLRGVTFEDSSVIMPETDEMCVEFVAGKIIQIENLQEDIDEQTSFQGFFAEVYCSAYVNSLVTMKDGLYQIFPGGLDMKIETELQRAYGPFDQTQLDDKEMTAITAYMDAIADGSYVSDDSVLIDNVEPLSEALAMCKGSVQEEMEQAK